MKNDWKFYTTHEGISFIRNTALDEKNYYRMRVFMKNYFKNRYADDTRKQTSCINLKFYPIHKLNVDSKIIHNYEEKLFNENMKK